MAHDIDIPGVARVRHLRDDDLAHMADCSYPDGAGGLFLRNVRDTVLEMVTHYGVEPAALINNDEARHEVADGAPNCYTYTRWQEFVDLGAYREDVTDFGPIENMTDAAAVALYMIAARLYDALVEMLVAAAAEMEG